MKSDVLQDLLDLTRSQNDLRMRVAKTLVAGSVLASGVSRGRLVSQDDIIEAVKVARRVWDEVLRQEGSGGTTN